MFKWLKKLFDRRCDYYGTCKLRRIGDDCCERGPTYFDGIDTKSYCGHYRILDNWEKPEPFK
jgi:hypothetical protein